MEAKHNAQGRLRLQPLAILFKFDKNDKPYTYILLAWYDGNDIGAVQPATQIQSPK